MGIASLPGPKVGGCKDSITIIASAIAPQAEQDDSSTFEIVGNELKPHRILEQPNIVNLNHYIRFDGDAEHVLKPYIVITGSQCLAVLFVGAAPLVNIAFPISIFVVVNNELSYSSISSIHLGECRKPHLYRNTNAVFGNCFQPPFNYLIYIKPHEQLFIPDDESV
ncbi:hypothetical protein CGCF413_v004435 [Colletotrichum fructicola]|nr:hypothetical protein CGCF413_v004435 [Colletotrichum fructicola]